MIDKKTINNAVEQLVNTYSPLKVYLFGSYAWGNPSESSDLDFLIIINDSILKKDQRAIEGFRALKDVDYPKDILVYTQKEFLENSQEEASLCFKVKNKGVILYERI